MSKASERKGEQPMSVMQLCSLRAQRGAYGGHIKFDRTMRAKWGKPSGNRFESSRKAGFLESISLRSRKMPEMRHVQRLWCFHDLCYITNLATPSKRAKYSHPKWTKHVSIVFLKGQWSPNGRLLGEAVNVFVTFEDSEIGSGLAAVMDNGSSMATRDGCQHHLRRRPVDKNGWPILVVCGGVLGQQDCVLMMQGKLSKLDAKQFLKDSWVGLLVNETSIKGEHTQTWQMHPQAKIIIKMNFTCQFVFLSQRPKNSWTKWLDPSKQNSPRVKSETFLRFVFSSSRRLPDTGSGTT